MSDLMLLGVLRMPMDDADPLAVAQYVARGRQAADEIERLRAEAAGLREFVEHVRRNGSTHLANMAVAVLAARKGGGMITWHKGPPPSCGWWPTKKGRHGYHLRWWNGLWSRGAARLDSARAAAWLAEQPEGDWIQPHIEWTERPDWWPERSKT